MNGVQAGRHRVVRFAGVLSLFTGLATAITQPASADPVPGAPTVQDQSITDPYDLHSGGFVHLGRLAAGAVVPAGGALTITVDGCMPALHRGLTFQPDGTVGVNNQIVMDVTCTFHGTDQNGVASNTATVHVVVPSPGLPRIVDHTVNLIVGQNGRSETLFSGLLAGNAVDPAGGGLSFRTTSCTPADHPSVAIAASGDVSVGLLVPVDLACTVRATDAAGQQSNSATLRVVVAPTAAPSLRDQAVAQDYDTDRTWDGVLSRGAVNPAGGPLRYFLVSHRLIDPPAASTTAGLIGTW